MPTNRDSKAATRLRCPPLPGFPPAVALCAARGLHSPASASMLPQRSSPDAAATAEMRTRTSETAPASSSPCGGDGGWYIGVGYALALLNGSKPDTPLSDSPWHGTAPPTASPPSASSSPPGHTTRLSSVSPPASVLRR